MAKSELFARWYSGRISPVYAERQSPGNIFFVSSTTPVGVDAVGYGDNPERPYATIAYAYAAATTISGDLIIVMPGHTETYATAASLVMNKENVTLLGVGNGNLRPLITFNGGGVTPGVDIDITGTHNTIKNFRFLNTEDGATGPFDISGEYTIIEDCVFEDDGTDNTVNWIDLAATADHCLIKNCQNYGTDTAGNDAWITISGAGCDHLRVINCHSHGNFAAANIEMTAAATDIEIAYCLLENVNAVDVNIECFAAATGWIHHCGFQVPTDGLLTFVNTLGNISIWECYGVNQPGETGLLTINGVVTPLCTVP